MTDARYPIGRFAPVIALTPAQRAACIAQIAAAPDGLRRAVAGLDDRQLDTPYRPGGWTVRQVVHHLPDSHLNAYTRFKLACTEETPTIKAYDEARWAELEEARTVRHPEWGTPSVDFLLPQYAWHGRHHTAQITTLRERMGWG